MPRAKNPELLAVVERQMVMGLTVPECLSEIEDDGELRCTERTLKRYRADIRQRWDTEEVELRPQRRAEFRAMVRFGFRDSIASRQHIAAAQFAKILAKLDGLEAPARLDINIGISVRAMTPMQREKIASGIRCIALCWCIGRAEVAEIDEINILRASHLAMKQAAAKLKLANAFILIDGLPVPDLPYPSLNVIKGDAKCATIAAASIVAKVCRDERMAEFDTEYPEYGFKTHKGYATKKHLEALRRYGPCSIHRRSFSPVANLLKTIPNASIAKNL